jgi:uncharacterized protein
MPVSTKLTRSCNLGCSYCYQTAARIVHNASSARDYDIEAVVKTLEEEWVWEKQHLGKARQAVIHGGEPLLVTKPDLERLFKLNYERFGAASIQTNGVLIDDDHIRMFKTYRVDVGISIDGWGYLNSARQLGGDLKATLKATARTMRNMQRLADEHKPPGMITILTKANATEEQCPGTNRSRIDHFFEFIHWTYGLGMHGGRLNVGHVDVPLIQPRLQLSVPELQTFWRRLVPWAFEHDYRFQQLDEVRDAMLGLNSQTCTKTYCDPCFTKAERTVREDGSRGQCEHSYGTDGIPYLIAEDGQEEDTRYNLLAQVPWEFGGCFGGPQEQDGKHTCKWWATCNGQCPGQGIDGDWRNRSRFCEAWATLYNEVYKQVKKMMPNAVLLPEVAHRFDPHELYHSTRNFKPPWTWDAWLRRRNTKSPSTWRGQTRQKDRCERSAEEAVYGKPKDDRPDQDGVRHADGPHGDGWTHGDSDAA